MFNHRLVEVNRYYEGFLEKVVFVVDDIVRGCYYSKAVVDDGNLKKEIKKVVDTRLLK
ncbi:hypothetical protein [Cytobacillus purgationiresistens]|uniref:Uncharacterized protein n=1 Tax=Cytobacillus purgationiresistens TaxID=863449 RepID=A0ABU0APS7_9BACI|nr:hypothetical protein [Cytobacillus purgationiresistens]MDQ0273298.1 hypothetical protein [Cytobacillus purgationiresistens]